jgi:translation initiation factor IF-3
MQRRNDTAGYRINHGIGVPEVRLVGENVVNPGIYPTSEALRMAEGLSLDLVEISPQASPPVCKIIDFQKFLYQQRRKQKEMKANAVKVEVKEIRFGPNTGEHDYTFKLKHAESFLKEGNKVKAYVFFRGREIQFKEQGEALLARFAADLETLCKVEASPKLEGKRMNMILVPKPKSSK